MKVPFHLRRRVVADDEPGPASALLLEAESVDRLLDLVDRLGQARPPAVYRVAGGYLIKPAGGEGGGRPAVGATRLRTLAEGLDLYLPVDADLVPALLDDEARGLTRDRGLVFLPGGRVLAYDARAPLAWSELVRADRHPSLGGWRAFPERPPRPERIESITLEMPAPSLDDLFGPTSTDPGPGDDRADAGGDPASTESDDRSPGPGKAGSAASIAGRAAVGLGKGLMGLGKLLGMKGLARVGAGWVARAVERVPELTEAVIGKQQAALRELLRQFRDGEIDRALRHALPVGGDDDQPARGDYASADDRLPTVDPTYSLQALLAGSGGGGGRGIWRGGGDLQAELKKEYLKAARLAEDRGDFRRAAYIHARPLGDYATAAHLLARGGLFRDAALIYLDRLHNIPAAAKAFESAGEVDRALELYRIKAMHVEAGDLLRRVGDEDRAVVEYVQAAALIVQGGQDNHRRLTAGDLLRDRARRPDLAIEHYRRGWDARPSTNAVPCALRLASIHADRGDPAPLLVICDQADQLFADHPDLGSMAADFYNQFAALADRPALDIARDDLRDRSLMGLAAQLRRSVGRGRPAQAASAYFGQSRVWPADVVGDAGHALKAASDRESRRPARSPTLALPAPRREARRISINSGTVTAACHAAAAGEVFLGFAGGDVYRVVLALGEVSRLEGNPLQVASLSVDPEAGVLVMLLDAGDSAHDLVYRYKTADSSQWSHDSRPIFGAGDCWLTPVLNLDKGHAVGLWEGEDLTLLTGKAGPMMWPCKSISLPSLKTEPQAALLIPTMTREGPSLTILIHDGPDLCHVDQYGNLINRRLLNWSPALPDGNTLRSTPLASLQLDHERVELAGLDGDGVIHWSALKVNKDELIRASSAVIAADPPYHATTLVSAGVVAGVRAGQVDWYRCRDSSYSLIASAPHPFQAPVACFASPRSNELIVVQADGTLVCVPAPPPRPAT